jgi:hypothetical protein
MQMSIRFLAEDFRKLLDTLDNITEADAAKPEDAAEQPADDNAEPAPEAESEPDHTNIDDMLTTDRNEDISKESVEDVTTLIDYLDQFAELEDWRDHNAAYDDAYYNDVPVDDIIALTGLSEEDLQRISDATGPNEGSIWMHDGKVTVFGGD